MPIGARASLTAALAAGAFGAAAEPCAAPGATPRPAAADAPMAWSGPDGRRSLDRGWRVGARIVDLPYSPNARGIASLATYRGSVARFRRRFAVAGGDYAIRFESVHHRARVWLDGRLVARHTGAYLPFEVRRRLAAGEHRLVVEADWRSPERMRSDGWFRSWFNYGGINREVTIRRLGASELDSPGIQTRLAAGGAADVTVTVRVRNRDRPRAVRVAGTLGGARLWFAPVRLATGASAWVRARVRLARPALWAPGQPNLAELRLAVPGEPGYRARVGLRELRWRGGRLYLNGRRLQLRGASLQEDARGRGDALRPREMDALVARLEAIGANATRAQHSLSPALMERLDRAGILVWQGVGKFDVPGRWQGPEPVAQALAVRRVRLDVLANRAHPSVLTWNLVNEVAFNGAARAQRDYVVEAARVARALDPGRPIAVDVWGTHLPDRPGRLYRAVDAVGGTNYAGWYDALWSPGPVVDAGIRAWMRRMRALFPDKVLVVTEFGAEANGLNAPAAPGGLRFQARLLERHIRAYRSDTRFSGMIAWALQDFALRPNFLGGSVRAHAPGLVLVRGINAKGLFTYGGRPKPAVATVRRLFR